MAGTSPELHCQEQSRTSTLPPAAYRRPPGTYLHLAASRARAGSAGWTEGWTGAWTGSPPPPAHRPSPAPRAAPPLEARSSGRTAQSGGNYVVTTEREQQARRRTAARQELGQERRQGRASASSSAQRRSSGAFRVTGPVSAAGPQGPTAPFLVVLLVVAAVVVALSSFPLPSAASTFTTARTLHEAAGLMAVARWPANGLPQPPQPGGQSRSIYQQ